MRAYGTKHLPLTSRNHHYQIDPKGGVDSMVSFGLGCFLTWDSSCFGRFLEMRSAFIEVRAILDVTLQGLPDLALIFDFFARGADGQ
jgi:hypothetical protein